MNRFLGATEQAQQAQSAAATVDPGHHYTYGVEALATGANATVTQQFQILNNNFEADFLVSQSTGKFKAQIKIGDRYLSNIPIHSDNHFGTAQAPLPLLAPLKLVKNAVVQVSITDLSGAQNDIRLGFIGRELS
ncbi:MAG: hypothetical protein CXZ00_03000 [Acidobacteria bacterium]|nr:MAG: hypothetical protein CXZ00_03000 [Acidobacteriota bacterium]